MAKARVLTRSELAEHLGVDKQMVTKWERSGMPVHTRGRGVASQFRLREVRAWLKVREAKAKAAEKAKVREANLIASLLELASLAVPVANDAARGAR